MQTTSHFRRAGVTLIEILVVIAIIAVLASLLLGGVMVFMGKGPELVNKNDIEQLKISLGRFKTDKGFYPPSQLRLRNSRAAYGTTPLEQQSLSFISAMWPQLDFTNVRWDGSSGATAIDYTLEGDQCLVFFLGGPPNPGGATLMGGFASDPRNPITGGGDRKRWYDFDAARLVVRNPGFPSYRDAYKQIPFVYFSSNRRPNGYDRTNPAGGTPVNTLGVSPYMDSATTYYNPDSFQIVSAGVNLQFGTGGLWNEANAQTYGAANGGAGKDDMTNFYSKLMGN